jgi:hypothetical protein
VAVGEEPVRQVRADETGAPRDQDPHPPRVNRTAAPRAQLT